MNVLEQLKAMGFEEKPLQFYDGGEGGGGDPSGGGDGPSGGGEGPGGSDPSSEVSSDYGGTGPSLGDTVGQGSVSGPMSGYSPLSEVAAVQAAIDAGLGVGTGTPGAKGSNEAVAQAVQDAMSGSLTASDIAALNAAGLGPAVGFNINNPTQSVEEMQAAQNVAWGIQNIGIPLLTSAVPGANALFSAAKGISGLLSGQISPGQTAANTALSVAASQLNVPVGTLTAMINGDMGKAAANTAMGAFTQALSSATNLPSGIIGTALNATGFGKEANQAITGMINQGLGITPSNNVGAIGSAIDQALGFTPGGGFNLSVDAAGNPTFNPSDFSGTGDPSEPPATAPSPAPAPAAQSGTNTAAALAALAAMGMQEDETPEAYKVAQIPVKSPFGTLPYGMDKTMPYGLRG